MTRRIAQTPAGKGYEIATVVMNALAMYHQSMESEEIVEAIAAELREAGIRNSREMAQGIADAIQC